MSRHSQCTAKKIKEICAFLEQGCPIEDAAVLSDVCKDTYYDWRARGERGEQPYLDFLRQSDKARAQGRLYYLKIIQQAVAHPRQVNAKPAQWFLSRSDRPHWGGTLKVEQTVQVTQLSALYEELDD